LQYGFIGRKAGVQVDWVMLIEPDLIGVVLMLLSPSNDRACSLLLLLGTVISFPGKLASLYRSWQSKEGTYRALGMAGIEPTPFKSEYDWTQL
jgi:hypothetical protein